VSESVKTDVLAASPSEPLVNPAARPTKSKDKKEKENRADKSIEVMLKVISLNSQRLSDQADGKARILITVNSIIISVLLGTVVRKQNVDSHLTLPTLLLLTVSLVTIVFSILATRPHIADGTFNKQDAAAGHVNLLFFGNFYRMPFEDYATGMQQMMQEKNAIYASLLRDVYNQGVVLGRKYHKLTLAYNVFMFGLVVAVVAFFVAAKYLAPS
jgi:hypothetical protein